MHNTRCATLRQTQSFPQPDSVYRVPTAREYDIYGHGKPVPAPRKKSKRVNKHTPNLVVYSDISEDDDVPNVSAIGVDVTAQPYNDPVLARVRLRSYLAAAGSATQPPTDVVVMRGVGAGHSSPQSDLNTSTQTDNSSGFSDAVLDRVEHYVRQQPLPWRLKDLLSGLFRILPNHDPSMLATALASVIRGVRIASEEISRESSAQPVLHFEGRDVLIIGDNLVYLMRASGAGTII